MLEVHSDYTTSGEIFSIFEQRFEEVGDVMGPPHYSKRYAYVVPPFLSYL
jgi:hypothetical protein